MNNIIEEGELAHRGEEVKNRAVKFQFPNLNIEVGESVTPDSCHNYNREKVGRNLTADKTKTLAGSTPALFNYNY